MTWQIVAHLEELAPGKRKLLEVAGRRLALFVQGEEIIAIDNHCPHRGGPIGAGPLSGETLTCPWHGLAFDLKSGRCEASPSLALVRLPLRIVDSDIMVDTDAPRVAASGAIHRYLVRYGLPGHVGRFGSIERIACRRGDRVLVSTDRGQEVGEVLVSADDYDASDERTPAGETLRVLDATELAAVAETSSQGHALLNQAQQEIAVAQAGVVVLDAELTFDRQTLILYHPGEASAALGPLATQLAVALQAPRVQFESLTRDAGRKTASAAGPSQNHTGDADMRGPYERLKYDFRRVWECPVCHHRERTAGTVTSMFCGCQAKEEAIKQVPMKLIDDGPRRTDGKALPQRKSTLP